MRHAGSNANLPQYNAEKLHPAAQKHNLNHNLNRNLNHLCGPEPRPVLSRTEKERSQ